MPFISKQFKLDNLSHSIETIKKGNFHTLLTSSFSQYNFRHLLGNMLCLFYFGRLVEQSFGPLVLLKLYFAGALLGGLFSLYYLYSIKNEKNGNVGASSAIASIISFFIMSFPKKKYLFFCQLGFLDFFYL